MSENKKPLNIEQAHNYLKQTEESKKADIKTEANKQKISVALPQDRKAYLIYGLSFLTDTSEAIKRVFCAITNQSIEIYATKEVAAFLRKILALRINGYTAQQIAYHVKKTPEVITQVEALAIKAIGERITMSQANGIPIVGA